MTQLIDALKYPYVAYLIVITVFAIASLHKMNLREALVALGMLVFVAPFIPFLAVLWIVAEVALELLALAFRFNPPTLPSPFEWVGNLLRGYKIDRAHC